MAATGPGGDLCLGSQQLTHEIVSDSVDMVAETATHAALFPVDQEGFKS